MATTIYDYLRSKDWTALSAKRVERSILTDPVASAVYQAWPICSGDRVKVELGDWLIIVSFEYDQESGWGSCGNEWKHSAIPNPEWRPDRYYARNNVYRYYYLESGESLREWAESLIPQYGKAKAWEKATRWAYEEMKRYRDGDYMVLRVGVRHKSLPAYELGSHALAAVEYSPIWLAEAAIDIYQTALEEAKQELTKIREAVCA